MAHSPPCRLLFSLLLLLLLSLSTLASSFNFHAIPKPKPKPIEASIAPAPSPYPPVPSAPLPILLACNATRFRSLCVSTLTSHSPPLGSPIPRSLLSISFSASLSSILPAISTAKSIFSHSSNNANLSNAASNCIELLTLSSHRLATASKLISLPSARIHSSAALLYQYDCWSSYKYVNDSKTISDAMAFLANNLTAQTSNIVSMLAAMERYGNDTSLWTPPQTERDGYWPKAASSRFSAWSGMTGVPTWLKPNVTVCKTGTCKYHTVQKAVDAAPKKASKWYVVYIKAGVYEETVRVPSEKTNVVFVGDGMGRTVITGSLNADMVGVSTYNTATVGIQGDGFMARDLTFENTAGPNAHQAVAFRSDSEGSVLDSVEFVGHQDTVYAHSMRQFYTNCRILGTLDFIFGNSASVFHNCSILVVPRQLNPHHGEENSTAHKVYLGRPWKEYSRTVFINCSMDRIIRPEGWLPWKGDFALKTLYYGEYGSSGPGGNVTGRVPWSSQIPPEHLAIYSVENFIQGDQWIPNYKGRKYVRR
ncbi:putative pectinesterase/pectinesterase inhibitor 51 [Carex littledalei]|uniref:Pectinesterase n=1 Tax=Carex littledalei TaxID=544730 RepID=A0A833VN92_9POAL|nr:putative pectinesterase/pectinesterase inhibitor 51 [Carex littledalei]